jgi:hypothetical protein
VTWVGGSGESVPRTREVGTVRAGRRKVALVVDELSALVVHSPPAGSGAGA